MLLGGGVLIEVFSEIPIWEGLTPLQIIIKVVVLGETPDAKCVKNPGNTRNMHTMFLQCAKLSRNLNDFSAFAEHECLNYISFSTIEGILLMTCTLL